MKMPTKQQTLRLIGILVVLIALFYSDKFETRVDAIADRAAVDTLFGDHANQTEPVSYRGREMR